MRKINVLVTDDSPLIRKRIIRFLEKWDFVATIFQAECGETAVKGMKAHPEIDAVIMDINMPGIDGITAMQMINDFSDTPCIIYSSFTEKNLSLTYEAIELGAFDVIHKPHGVGSISFEDSMELMRKSLLLLTKKQQNVNSITSSNGLRGIIVIGVSTGGPKVLREIIPQISPLDYHSVVIMQHMPEKSIERYAKRMNEYSQMPTSLAQNNELVRPGEIYIAPGSRNLLLSPATDGVKFVLQVPTKNQVCVPMIDVTFQSCGELFGRHATAVVLTGMGNDGSAGAKIIKENGGRVFIESEETCVVYGMPSSVKDATKIDGEYPSYKIAEVINKIKFDKDNAA